MISAEAKQTVIDTLNGRLNELHERIERDSRPHCRKRNAPIVRCWQIELRQVEAALNELDPVQFGIGAYLTSAR